MTLIKEKLRGKVKGQKCSDGITQRGYILREDASSPTLSLEALLSIFLVDAYKGHDVAIFDVRGAYLNANISNEKYVSIKLEGEFVDIMCGVNIYTKYPVRKWKEGALFEDSEGSIQMH